MSETVESEYRPDRVSPPGATLRDVLEDRGMSQSELSERMGRSRKTVNEIMKGKAPITPETALMLERVLGVAASFWNNREHYYRESVARREERKRLSRHSAWRNALPASAMARLGWISVSKDSVELTRELLGFFGVASPQQWHQVWDAMEASFRRSKAFQSDCAAVAAWLRRGEIEAARIDTESYDPGRFREALQHVRGLTRSGPRVFRPQLEELCAEAGVAVTFVPELPKTRVSGSARWLSSTKALIQLSLRHKTDDHLWFTFFHEAAHVLLHPKRAVFLEVTSGVRENAEEESQADRFAADSLIPPKEYEAFVSARRFSPAAIRSCARSVGIAPGILVGRLQHDGYVPFRSSLNGLKRSFKWTH